MVTCQLKEALALSAGGVNAGDSLGATINGHVAWFLFMPVQVTRMVPWRDIHALLCGCLTSLIGQLQKQEKE